jgi:hypothetical protein
MVETALDGEKKAIKKNNQIRKIWKYQKED